MASARAAGVRSARATSRRRLRSSRPGPRSAPDTLRATGPSSTQRHQREHFLLGEALGIGLIGADPRRVLEAAVVPGPLQGFTGEQGRNGVDAGPVLGTSHQALLAAMREDIEQTTDLRSLLLADRDRVIAPRPDLALPAGETDDLLGEL